MFPGQNVVRICDRSHAYYIPNPVQPPGVLTYQGYDFIYPKFGVRHRTVWYIAMYVSGERATCISTVDGDYDLPDYTASCHRIQ
jgi:hypothetical protein